ncbi:integumentary mucin C.1-like [Mizuhopecten yessoensis]|uniref:integumentary mucin C.1-like n=1 Tax=Mizuhopecten yessoensis TaxID=6573 RepID=UPI000B45D249|nr:integumentary mucin C.1-like [Mizuhopecten yessoensis]
MSMVDCYNDVLTDIISKCDGKSTCTLSPSSSQYGGDPCPATYKYLQVQFNCSSAETTPDSKTTTLSKKTTTTTTTTTTTEQSTDSDTTAVFLPPTTDPSSTTASFVKTNATSTCISRYANATSCTDGELLCELAKLKKQLPIDNTTRSSYKRTKISVYVGRTAATDIGMN